MRCALIVAFFFPVLVIAQDQAASSSDVETTIRRGLEFVAADSIKWRNDHQCVSCHHAALTSWAMHEAKLKGRAVDEVLLAELTRWMTESGEGKTSVPRPEGRPKALNTKAIYFALALASDPNPDPASQEAIKRLLKTVKEDQLDDGSWHAWPETRPPFFGGSDDSMTALATLAASNSKEETMRQVRDRGVRWLTETKSDDDPQSVALRLMVWVRAGGPPEQRDQLVRLISSRQRDDGGWSQQRDMASDAWATGQALYALSLAGLKSDDPAIELGRRFLVKTQHEDGSWPMTSRATKPGGAGSTSLIPIIGGGSAWGMIGLLHSL